ncbi:MAG: type I 3-dehydroquinate dehydratase [Planctomycetota bacterium]
MLGPIRAPTGAGAGRGLTVTMLCVPILADEPATAKRDAVLAAEMGADIVEFRVDLLMELEESLESRIAIIKNLVEESALPCIVTCRPEWEGGLYSGDEDERVSMFEAVGTADSPPAYIDFELKAYTSSANIRQKINLAVDHPNQQRAVRTRLILSTHDFEGRPADLTRRLIAMHDEPACAVVKVAYRARSIRDNLELFDILSDRQKPTIALGMGEFGTMSRILAPKFGGFLTFASLRDESATAPGQPTIRDLLEVYRFRSIKPSTKVYGIIGWPVTQSMSPLVHNAGFGAIGWDGVYVPMPVAADVSDEQASDTSYFATLSALLDEQSKLGFCGASVTIPHKERTVRHTPRDLVPNRESAEASNIGAANTFKQAWTETGPDFWHSDGSYILNSDASAIRLLMQDTLTELSEKSVCIFGAGGVARAVAWVALNAGAHVCVCNRSRDRADRFIESLSVDREESWEGSLRTVGLSDTSSQYLDAYINCTPVGMVGGPDPDGLSIPIPDLPPLPPETVFFDTVYNPIETPMLREAKSRGYRTIDGVQMFVKQAEAQFELWTAQHSPEGLFDRLVRAKLTAEEKPDV